MAFTTVLNGFGTATYDVDDVANWVKVGDRWVPRRIVVQSPMPDQPDLRMTIEVRQGIPVYTEVTLQARSDGPDIRRKDLDIPLDDWLERFVGVCSMIAMEVDESGQPIPASEEAVRSSCGNGECASSAVWPSAYSIRTLAKGGRGLQGAHHGSTD